MKLYNKCSQIIKYTIAIFVIVAIFFLGRYSKKCNEISSQVIVHDTSYSSYPIEVERKVTKPINTIISNKRSNENIKNHTCTKSHDTVNIHDTSFIDYPTFHLKDTSGYKGIKVAVEGYGDCNGIPTLTYTYFGNFDKEIITNTITNTITKKPNLFQLNAGINTKFNSAYAIQDIGPVVGLQFKNKIQISYSYLLKEKSNNFVLTTKIK